jgi:hypothetical protein
MSAAIAPVFLHCKAAAIKLAAALVALKTDLQTGSGNGCFLVQLTTLTSKTRNTQNLFITSPNNSYLN